MIDFNIQSWTFTLRAICLSAKGQILVLKNFSALESKIVLKHTIY